MQDVTSKVSQEDMDNARMTRERSTHPPAFEPGMGEGDDDDFGGGSMDDFGNDDDFGGGGFGATGGAGGGFGVAGSNGFGGAGGGFGGMGGGMGMMGGMSQQAQNNDSAEDKFFEYLKKFFIGFKDFAKHFIAAIKGSDLRKRVNFGRYTFIMGLICAVIGLVCVFFTKTFGMQLLVSSLFAAAGGVVLFMFGYDKAKQLGVDLSVPEVQEQPDMPIDQEDFGVSGEVDFDDDDDEEEDEDDGDEDDGFDNLEIDIPTVTPQETALTAPPRDAEEVLSTVNVDKGMVTRQYLYETITQILPSCDATYDKETVFDEDSREFNAWDTIIKQAADVFRGNQEDSPNLMELKEKLFYYQLTVSRVKWIKNIDQLVTELVNIVKYDDNGGEDENVYGTGVYVGNKAIIKIYKGSTAMVSVKDAYRQCKDFILDTKNKIPVVLGIDSEGKVVVKDLTKIFALCVAGMPRSGKTWLVQSMLTQMCTYMKPSELIFYIYDPKDTVSDFKAMTMPHIKDFRSRDEDIVAGLKYIVKTESARRTEIIGNAGCVNIEDYKKMNPGVEMPYIYVIIDEVITFATRMKDEKPDLYNDFQSYLKELVSRCPNLGIRLFMIPHVIKNDIIKKTTTDLIPCRISVKGSPDHIEAITGTKQKDFPYNLSHSGDMAVLLDGHTNFCHAAILSSTNEENNKIFNFLTQLWMKIEPEGFKGSVYEKNQQKNFMSDSEMAENEEGVERFTARSGSTAVNVEHRRPTVKREMQTTTQRLGRKVENSGNSVAADDWEDVEDTDNDDEEESQVSVSNAETSSRGSSVSTTNNSSSVSLLSNADDGADGALSLLDEDWDNGW